MEIHSHPPSAGNNPPRREQQQPGGDPRGTENTSPEIHRRTKMMSTTATSLQRTPAPIMHREASNIPAITRGPQRMGSPPSRRPTSTMITGGGCRNHPTITGGRRNRQGIITSNRRCTPTARRPTSTIYTVGGCRNSAPTPGGMCRPAHRRDSDIRREHGTSCQAIKRHRRLEPLQRLAVRGGSK